MVARRMARIFLKDRPPPLPSAAPRGARHPSAFFRLCRGAVGRAASLFFLSWIAAVPGCQLAYLVGGNGTAPAAFVIPKKDRVLVLVDEAADSPMSIHAVAGLIGAVNTQLYAHRVAGQLVPPYRVIGLQRSNPVLYRKMGIADIAHALHADIVVYIFVRKFDVQFVSDRQVTRGFAQVLVKVVGAAGKRLWPLNATPGRAIAVRVAANFAMTQSPAVVEENLIAQIAARVAEIFYAHGYSYTPGRN